MIKNTKNSLTAGYAPLFLSFCLLVSVSAVSFAAENDSDKTLASTAKLEQMAEAAQCAAEHGQVAKQYRLRAEQLEARAVEHEKKAAQLEAKPKGPMHAKWPAMARKPWVKERELAVQARRASKEAQQLAERHVQLSVETLTASCRSSNDTPIGN
jgi:hypothetical protein